MFINCELSSYRGTGNVYYSRGLILLRYFKNIQDTPMITVGIQWLLVWFRVYSLRVPLVAWSKNLDWPPRGQILELVTRTNGETEIYLIKEYGPSKLTRKFWLLISFILGDVIFSSKINVWSTWIHRLCQVGTSIMYSLLLFGFTHGVTPYSSVESTLWHYKGKERGRRWSYVYSSWGLHTVWWVRWQPTKDLSSLSNPVDTQRIRSRITLLRVLPNCS